MASRTLCREITNSATRRSSRHGSVDATPPLLPAYLDEPDPISEHLLLHEARRVLVAEEVDAATAAVRVGYESVSQFNREYRRLFGGQTQ